MTEPASTAGRPPTPSSAPDGIAAVIVLAAGEGTRMKSSTAKVLHGFAGRSLLGHVLAAAAPLGAAQTLVVVGHQRDDVTAHLADVAPEAQAVVQERQQGTGHAVRVALESVPGDATGTVVVLAGDAPLLRADSLAELVTAHAAAGSAATLLTSVVSDPTGSKDGEMMAIDLARNKVDVLSPKTTMQGTYKPKP